MKILLVDDEKNIRQTLSLTMKSWGHEVVSVASVEEALAALRALPFDFMLTDFKLENRNGIELIRESKRVADPPIPAIMTAFASFENAVNAIKEGGFDYLPKPFSNSQLDHLLKRVSLLVELKHENQRLKKLSTPADYFFGQTSAAMVRLEEFFRKVSPTHGTILLMGESGTGKTSLAELIHRNSPVAHKNFRIVHCNSMGSSLGSAAGSEVSELEKIKQGTLLVDGVDELSPAGQTILFEFLEEKLAQNEVRIIAVASKSLDEAVRDGAFREDLYYRLNAFECVLVPLRFRKEDIPILIQKFYRGAKPIPTGVMKVLLAYDWPGNIRELRNVIERLQLLSQGREPQLDDLPDSVKEGRKRQEGVALGESIKNLEDLEREHVEKVLRLEPNQEKAAQILGITTVTLWRKRKQYGLP
jgi:NtrC-family two-component system response regulator AlgB